MKNLKWVRLLLLFVGISGAFSVLFGAWFTHAGQALSDAERSRVEIAQFYQFIHTLALFIAVLFYIKCSSKALLCACVFFCIGILFFSGSLYVKTFFGFSELALLIAKLAPFGGMSLALGWLSVIFISKKMFEIKN